MGIEEFLSKATYGKLTNEELLYVVQKIKEDYERYDDQLLIWMTVLERTGEEKYRYILEKFLKRNPNIFAAEHALKILCNDWNLTSEYLKEIKNFIKVVDWDVDYKLFLAAIFIAGRYLRENFDKELLEILFDVFENEKINRPSEDWYLFHRSLAYVNIIFSMGYDWEEILDTDDIEVALKENNTSILDHITLNKAKQLLK